MNDEQVKEILEDPKKLLNLLRLFHQLIHLYDEKELKKEMEKQKDKTSAQTGLGDTLSVVLKDKDGNVKQEINNNQNMKGG
jgi:hypothetical protein